MGGMRTIGAKATGAVLAGKARRNDTAWQSLHPMQFGRIAVSAMQRSSSEPQNPESRNPERGTSEPELRNLKTPEPENSICQAVTRNRVC